MISFTTDRATSDNSSRESSRSKLAALLLGGLVLAAFLTGCGAAASAQGPTPVFVTPTPLPLPTVAATPTTPPTQAPATAPAQAVATAAATAQQMEMATAPSIMTGGDEPTVNVTAKENDAGIVYTVDKSAVPAGKVKFVFKNEGKLTHELMVYSLQDISGMLNAKRQGQDVDEMDYIKGLAGSADDVDPGKTDSFEATLTPGFYELACHVLIKNKDGSTFTHFGKGQFFTLAVTGSGGPSPDISTASTRVNVKMTEGTGELAGSWLFVPDKLVVKAGDVTFNVTNEEKEEHDFAVYPIGDTTEFVSMQLQGGMEPDYDAIHAQVVQSNLEAGKSVSKTLNLTPGVYVAVCYMVSKNTDGSSFVHMERGQRFTFTVE